MKKISNILFVLLILIYIIGSFGLSIFKPKEINYSENRYAYKFKNINLKSFLNNKMQNNVECTLGDQIFLSKELKILNNLINGNLINYHKSKIYKNMPNDYLHVKNNIYFYGMDNLVYAPSNLDFVKNDLHKKILNYNKLIKKYKNVDFYAYYVEKDTDINFNTNKKSKIYEYINNNLKSKNNAKFNINNFDEYKKYFYKCDHHWNYKGSYKAYKDILKLLEIKYKPKVGKKICIDRPLCGSKASDIGFNRIVTDNLCAYLYDYIDMNITINGKPAEYTKVNDPKNFNNNNMTTYSDFYGKGESEIVFDTKNKNKDNILIIGDSYDNAILQLIAEQFNKTVSVDLRDYNLYKETGFDFNMYINKFKINKVLFIGGSDLYINDDWLIYLKGGY